MYSFYNQKRKLQIVKIDQISKNNPLIRDHCLLELIFILRVHEIIFNSDKVIIKIMRVTTLSRPKRESHKNQQTILSTHTALDTSQVWNQSYHPQDLKGPDEGRTASLHWDGGAGMALVLPLTPLWQNGYLVICILCIFLSMAKALQTRDKTEFRISAQSKLVKYS